MVRHSKFASILTRTSVTLRLEGLEAREVPAATQNLAAISDAPIATVESPTPAAIVAPSTTPATTAVAPVSTAATLDMSTEHSEGGVGLPLRAVPRSRFAVASGPGTTAQVNVYDSETNALIGILTPFGRGYTAGVRVATGDMTGDGIQDIVVAAGPGSPPWIKIYDGGTLAEIKTFLAYGYSFTGGLFVATGDFDGDGRMDLVTGAGAGGGPHVQIFNGADMFPPTVANSVPIPRESFFAYSPTFTGGVSVAAADINGDGRADVITGAGPGGGPHVQVFSGTDHHSIASFFAYEPTMALGILVTAGDLTGDGKPEIATTPMLGGAPIARAFTPEGRTLATYTPFDTTLRSGASVSIKDLDGDGIAELIIATGPKTTPQVKVVSAKTGATLREFPAFTPDYLGGMYVG